MKLGQISAISFISQVIGAAVGFVATLYVARSIGAEPLGIYNLALAVVSWISIAGTIGFSGAISKRVSEGSDQGKFAVAGATVVILLFVVLSIGFLITRTYLNDYIGFPATGFLVLILFSNLASATVNPLLVGLQLVHLRDILSTVRVFIRSVLHISLITVGLGVTGLFIGHIVAYLLIIGIGGYMVVRKLPELSRPEEQHLRSLGDFAKYAWVGRLRGRMFNYTDVIVLGFFVPQSLIGIYSVAWTIGTFLSIFTGSLQSTLYPALSEISAKDDVQAVENIVEQSLTYGGLFLIPGLFGGALLGERLLRIYGPEFTQGTTVLAILILANVVMGYQSQLLNTLNGIDRPDLAFRVNGTFVVANLALNVILVYLYGWVGAAVATATSVSISLIIAYRYVSAIINFDFPVIAITKQFMSAGIMTGFVYAGLWVENTHSVVNHNLVFIILLVPSGAGVYFLSLLWISHEFRETVSQNLPDEVPL
ncbi:oligosaccharide flippase family protein [Halorubrum ezzemoulense]|uniref:oligosaccharide flippase family protein n=1 Tax=Halorubrum ezzemoulense TaxID=337243 RepID=UPI00232DD2C9|nr:oligosaccharide flippase family protein [Halorubrum ezzemoulense]MDB9301071.1 oligosaccharide flippase family protein [Halorubrum ezzemoulense]